MILMYHNVARQPAFYSSLLGELEAHVEVLRERSVRVVPLRHYVDALERGGVPKDTAALTFDDAYTSFAELALPVLERAGYPAAVFVPVAHVGRSNSWDAEAAPEDFRILDGAALRDVARHPLVTVGSHGASHVSLGRVSEAELEREVCGSRRALEELTGTDVAFFAFPYGQRRDVPDAGPALLRRCGYRAALTTRWTRAPRRADLYRLGRIEVTAGDDAGRFARKLFGRPDTWRLRQAVRDLRSLFA